MMVRIGRGIQQPDPGDGANARGQRLEHIGSPALAKVRDTLREAGGHRLDRPAGHAPEAWPAGCGARDRYSSLASATREKWITLTASSMATVRP